MIKYLSNYTFWIGIHVKTPEAGIKRCSLTQISKKTSKKPGPWWCIQMNINKSTDKPFSTKC